MELEDEAKERFREAFDDFSRADVDEAWDMACGDENRAANFLLDKYTLDDESSDAEGHQDLVDYEYSPESESSGDELDEAGNELVDPDDDIDLELLENDAIDESELDELEVPVNTGLAIEVEVPQVEVASAIELAVRLIVPPMSMNDNDLKRYVQGVLKNCKCQMQIIQKIGEIPRAEYEVPMMEWKMLLGLSDKSLKSIQEFTSHFCKFSANGLHEQIFMEVANLPFLFKHSRGVYNRHVLSVHNIALGNCPNPGTFFIRGDYFTNINQYSNSQLAAQFNQRHHRDQTTQLNIAGPRKHISYVEFEHDRRQVQVLFAVKFSKPKLDGLQYAGYKMTFNYSSIEQIVADIKGPQQCNIYFRLKNPPLLWEGLSKTDTTRRTLTLQTCRDWIRVIEFAGNADHKYVGCSKQALADCQWLRLGFDTLGDSFYTVYDVIARLAKRSNAKIFFGAMFSIRRRPAVVTNPPSFGSFRADYAIQAMLSRGCVVNDQLFRFTPEDARAAEEHLFFKLVRWCMKECQRACEEALENLLSAIDERRNMEITRAFHHMYTIRKNAYRDIADGKTVRDADMKRNLPKNCVLVRKVMVTPLNIVFMAPEVMMANRVVRHFGEENALRCVFRDYNGYKLNIKDFVHHTSANEEFSLVANIVRTTLTHGLELLDRRYYFLAWSNSQMRDHGCYMYASVGDPMTNDPELTIKYMREWMGDFSGSKNVSKLMSRMGQCFTQAQPSVELRPDEWKVCPDIEGGAGHAETGETFCFSDGCGKMSAGLAATIAEELDLEIVPACYQVRFKGIKGVLSVDPYLDHMVDSELKVVFRESQKKFVDGDKSETALLEIVKYAMPSPLCLNRPMITILDWVSEKQSKEVHARMCRKIHYHLERELARLAEMLLNEKVASEELTQRLNLPIDFMAIRSSGISLTDEPFIRKMLVAVYKYNVQNHLTKAKIFLPPSMGRSMYGIVDETGLLQYGQVFIQYSPSIKKPSNKPILHLGKVLITKNPCHVAGDVRMFDAVFQPALQHLIDVVVFPRYGPRPHPDEMAGSDLDGDEYCVVFDKEMFFLHNEEPMVFPKSASTMSDSNPPTTEDMADFFLTYLRQDSIGQMSNAHLQMTDKLGLFHPICNDIARKCSIAVDFAKSGIPADPLRPEEKCDVLPDYMSKMYKPMYRSPRLNGQLYRKAKKVDEVLELAERATSVFESSIDEVFCPEGVDLFEGDPDARREAKRLSEDYANRVQQLLDEYGVSDEASIVSGHIASLKRLTAMERDDYSFYHTDKIVELRYAKIYHHFRTIFFQEFGGEENLIVTDSCGRSTIKTDSVMERKARRWYQITYKDHSSGPKMLSFPWIVWDVLCSFRKMEILRNPNLSTTYVECPLGEKFTEIIRELVDRETEDVGELRTDLEQMETFRRYLIAYGNGFLHPVYIIWQWLYKEKFFVDSAMTMNHVTLLFIQFALGIQHGGDGTAEKADSTTVYFREKLVPTEEPQPCENFSYEPGPVILAFLRYLSSQYFTLANYIDFSLDEGDTDTLLVLMKPNEWLPLSQLAFRAYHHIAVAGNFTSLGIGEDTDMWIEDECRDPVVVSADLFNAENYDLREPLTEQKILSRLEEWSGVSMISQRPASRFRMNNPPSLVFFIGTVAARQRLTRLLLLPARKLMKAIKEDKVPEEIRDDSL